MTETSGFARLAHKDRRGFLRIMTINRIKSTRTTYDDGPLAAMQLLHGQRGPSVSLVAIVSRFR
jgi:hypothetical protein